MRTARVPPFAITLARSFVAAAAFGYLFDLWHQTRDHLTNGPAGRPFGDDFVNYWSAAWLTLHDRVAEIYDIHAFHAFEQTVAGPTLSGYHYSYPPVMLLLSAPIALIPYVPALFVWLTASWYAFYRVLKAAMPGDHVLLFALATPAVLINAVGGQNGTLTAALLGGGLVLLERRPYLAGVLFGLMVYKPHLAILLPVALAAGRKWRTFFATAATAGLLLGASVLAFGPETWAHYLRLANVLRHVILEESGVVHRMVSVFVALRPLGVSVDTAYAIQAAFALVACVAVAVTWFKDTPAGIKYAVLLLGTCLTTPYLQDYDLVFGALVVAWLWQQPLERYPSERTLQVTCGLFLVLPLVAAALAHLTHLTYGPLFILPLFVLAVRAAFVVPQAESAAPAAKAAGSVQLG
jgi:arabinofuranan 3-O-arabinosyltransferase